MKVYTFRISGNSSHAIEWAGGSTWSRVQGRLGAASSAPLALDTAMSVSAFTRRCRVDASVHSTDTCGSAARPSAGSECSPRRTQRAKGAGGTGHALPHHPMHK